MNGLLKMVEALKKEKKSRKKIFSDKIIFGL